MPSMRVSTPALVALGIGAAIVALFVFFYFSLSAATPSKNQDQCSKPVSQRIGGWTCPGSQPASS